MDTVLVTGATGFIGSNFIKKLKALNKYNIVLLSSKIIEGYTCVLHKDYTFKKEDFSSIGITEIDYVIHIGAFIPKVVSDANNTKMCNSNIINTAYLFNNVPKINKKIVFLSSIDVYGQPEGVLDEKSPTLPKTLYGLSKIYCEKMLQELCATRGIDIQVLRIGHIYGAGEYKYKKFIPVAIKSAKVERKISIFTKGQERRAFLHIDDCCNFIIKSMELDTDCGIINVASSNAISILEIAKLIAQNSEEVVEIDVRGEYDTVNDFLFDTTKREKLLGVENVNLLEGIADEYRAL